MKNFVFTFLLFLFSTVSFGQITHVIAQLPFLDSTDLIPLTEYTNEEKDELLKMLPNDEPLEFISDYDYDEETEEIIDTHYYEIEYGGLYFLDLDFDGDIDLLYSGRSGSMTQSRTKIFYNIDGVLKLKQSIKNRIIDIHIEKKQINIYTLFKPCCGSYTNIFSQYTFSEKQKGEFQSSISHIGMNYYYPKKMYDFELGEELSIKEPSLLMLPTDLKGSSYYFGERDKEVNTKMKAHQIVELIQLSGTIKYHVLGETEFEGEKYHLIITAALDDLPKKPTSLFEWSDGDSRRLIGWIKAEI